MNNWQPFPATINLDATTVYLVGISINNIVLTEEHQSLLSTQELAKAARFKFDIHRQRYLVFHACLRMILARCLHTQPALLQFATGLHKKPYLNDYPQLQFNLSHSDNEAIVAITLDADIGVDIEKIKTEPMKELAKRFFSAAEFAYLNSLPPSEQIHAFYQFWAHKEAFIKATGLGLSQGLQNFTIGLQPSRLIAATDTDFSAWTLQSFHWQDGYASAFAVNKAITNVICYHFKP
ncbi:MAG: 4'-phosphopantetheinyl transferase family protein [Gammaproteobacteria bacterium]